jgi:dTDP-glucose pyrophosphorylase
MIQTALILANNSETVQVDSGQAYSSPWINVFGLPVIKRIILTAKKVGIKKFLVMIRPEDEARLAGVRRDARLGDVTIEGIVSPDDRPTQSLLKVRDRLQEPFLLLSGDHLCSVPLLNALQQQGREPFKAILCIDKNLAHAARDAVAKVAVRNGQVTDVGEHLSAYEAMDTGIYLYSPEVLDSAQQLVSQGAADGSLSRLHQFLIQRQGGVEYGDVNESVWMRVRTMDDAKHAEEALFQRSGKPTDGIYARFNKQVVGRPLIHLFLKMPITPNMISLIGLALGGLSGVAFAVGGYANAVIGAGLSYASCIMDHCDGVVARLKHKESAFGTWLETACDYTAYVGIFSGMAIGLYRESGHPLYLYTGALFVLGTILSFLATSYQRKKYSGDRPQDYALRWHQKVEADRTNPISFFSRHVYFLTRRATMPYWILIFTLFNLRPFLLFFCTFGANLFWILALYSNRLFKRPDAVG